MCAICYRLPSLSSHLLEPYVKEDSKGTGSSQSHPSHRGWTSAKELQHWVYIYPLAVKAIWGAIPQVLSIRLAAN